MKKQYKYLIAALAILIVAASGYSLIKNVKAKKDVKTPFGISQTAVYFYPSINKEGKPEFYDDITLSVGNTTGWPDEDRRIRKASFENIKLIKEPKVGIFSILKPTNNPAKPFNANDLTYNISNARRYDITVLPGNINANFNPDSIGQLGGLVHLYYYSNGFKIVNSSQTSDFPSAMKSLGLTNNDVKSKIAFDLQVVNQKGQTFVKHFELDLPASDINNQKTYSESKLYDVDKNMFNVK